jgi:hypothetical protein
VNAYGTQAGIWRKIDPNDLLLAFCLQSGHAIPSLGVKLRHMRTGEEGIAVQHGMQCQLHLRGPDIGICCKVT